MADALLVSRSLLLPLACALALPLLLLALNKVPLAYNLRHLAVRWKSTFVTALAFTLVVFLLMLMLAFVNGMERLTQTGVLPGNVIVLSQGVTDELLSYIPVADAGDVGLQPGVLRNAQGRPLCSRETYTAISQPGASAAERPEQRLLQIRGVEDAELAARLHDLELYPGGRWFSKVGVGKLAAQEQTSPSEQYVVEAVLGEGVARELGLAVGDVFAVGPRRWLAVGILKAAGSPFGAEIWADSRVVGQTFGLENAYTSIILATPDAASARQLARELSTRYKKAALWALPETEYYAKMAAMNQSFLVAAYLVASFMAVAGALSVMNTLFAAVAQRRQEIAVLRVLGYTRGQIMLSFLVEALALALAGGMTGCVLGFLAQGWTATCTVSGDQGSGKEVALKLVVDGNIVTVSLLFTLVMGVAGGLLPAWSATRLRLLGSLR
jgi:ABC-type lipoprotein release transport system permease subunit